MALSDSQNRTSRENLDARGRVLVATHEAELRRAIDSFEWERRGLLQRLARRRAR